MVLKFTDANGVQGILLNPYHSDGKWVFRVMHNDYTFTDYDLDHSDLCVTITDKDAAFYEHEDGRVALDHGPDTCVARTLENNMKIGPWVAVKETYNGIEHIVGMTRVKIGGDVDNISDRIAFIEKTPRIRIRPADHGVEGNDFLNWAARSFKGDGPDDKDSMNWCNQALKLFGYED